MRNIELIKARRAPVPLRKRGSFKHVNQIEKMPWGYELEKKKNKVHLTNFEFFPSLNRRSIDQLLQFKSSRTPSFSILYCERGNHWFLGISLSDLRAIWSLLIPLLIWAVLRNNIDQQKLTRDGLWGTLSQLTYTNVQNITCGSILSFLSCILGYLFLYISLVNSVLFKYSDYCQVSSGIHLGRGSHDQLKKDPTIRVGPHILWKIKVQFERSVTCHKVWYRIVQG